MWLFSRWFSSFYSLLIGTEKLQKISLLKAIICWEDYRSMRHNTMLWPGRTLSGRWTWSSGRSELLYPIMSARVFACHGLHQSLQVLLTVCNPVLGGRRVLHFAPSWKHIRLRINFIWQDWQRMTGIILMNLEADGRFSSDINIISRDLNTFNFTSSLLI